MWAPRIGRVQLHASLGLVPLEPGLDMLGKAMSVQRAGSLLSFKSS
jgi:hypothetical protein